MSYIITDNNQFIEVDNGTTVFFLKKKFDVDIVDNVIHLEYCECRTDFIDIPYSLITSPTAANITAMRTLLQGYNNTSSTGGGLATENTLASLSSKIPQLTLNGDSLKVYVSNQIDLTTITGYLLAIKNSVAAIDTNTDTVEAKIQATIDAINTDFAINHNDLVNIYNQVVAINSNTDTIEAALASILAKIISAPATESTLSALNAKFNTLGQKTMANSAPVVISSDQSAIPISGAITLSSKVSVQDVIQEIQFTGQYQGKTAYAFNLIGQRNGFTSTSALDGVKEYDNTVSDFAVTSNSTLDIISSSVNDTAAGTGIRTVKVTYIDNSNNLVESAAITLNGTTLVTSVLTDVNQVLWMETATAGSLAAAAGNIRLRINGGVVECEQITAGGNKSRSAIFKVPIGYTGYVVNWRVSAVNNDQDARLRGQVNTLDRSLATVFHYMSEKYCATNTSIPQHDIFLKIPALAKIKVSTISAGTGATVRCNTNILMVIIQD